MHKALFSKFNVNTFDRMTEEDIMWQLQQMEGQESDIEEHSQQEELEEEPKEIPQEEEKTEKIPELSDQDRINKFNELLKESNISPFAVYSVEYPKLMTDSRFSCEYLCLLTRDFY